MQLFPELQSILRVGKIMAEVVFEGHACVDCMMVIANGDTSGMTDGQLLSWRVGVDSTGLYKLGNVVMACPEDCEGEFSHSACDYCGSGLAGDRHPIAVLA